MQNILSGLLSQQNLFSSTHGSAPEGYQRDQLNTNFLNGEFKHFLMAVIYVLKYFFLVLQWKD